VVHDYSFGKFLLIDAVWTGKDRSACLAENAGHAVGRAGRYPGKFTQFIYGFYPEQERWRVNLTFIMAAILLLPLLIPRLPAKGLNAGLFFVALPIVGFFLLHGGGLKGFGISWTADFLSGFTTSIGDAGRKLAGVGEAKAVIGPLLVLLGRLIVFLSTAVSFVIWPLTWLRDQIQAAATRYGRICATAAIVSIALFVLNGGFRTGWRALIVSLAIFATIGIVIAAMGLDRGGLPIVDTRLWGDCWSPWWCRSPASLRRCRSASRWPLGRRSTIPLIRTFSVAFIEFWRGVPLITVLFFATYMLPLFLPAGFTVDGLVRALIGIALFAGALPGPKSFAAACRRFRAGRRKPPALSACPIGRPPA